MKPRISRVLLALLIAVGLSACMGPNPTDARYKCQHKLGSVDHPVKPYGAGIVTPAELEAAFRTRLVLAATHTCADGRLGLRYRANGFVLAVLQIPSDPGASQEANTRLNRQLDQPLGTQLHITPTEGWRYRDGKYFTVLAQVEYPDKMTPAKDQNIRAGVKQVIGLAVQRWSNIEPIAS